MTGRRLIFNAFTMNGVSHNNYGQWRAPTSQSRAYCDRRTWASFARTAERGLFDAVFWADVIGANDWYAGSYATSAREGAHLPGNDPSLLVPLMADNTEHLGFAFTSSIIQEHPFNFARRMSTLDHLTEGRVAWNVVTSYHRNAYRNFGHEDAIDHAGRYEWAEEYLDVVYKLWEGSWSDRAVRKDVEAGVYADPAEIRRIQHRGPRYQVAGPHLPEPSPQRTPVIYQAGTSPSGRDFASRHAEGVFIITPSPGAAAELIGDIRRRAVANGRSVDDIVFIQALSFIVGATPEEAAAKERKAMKHDSLQGYLAAMSGNLGIDLSTVDLDQPVQSMDVIGIQGFVDAMLADADAPVRTFADLVRLVGLSTRVAGTPDQIVDEIERWASVGVGGFNVTPVVFPTSLTEFVDHVVPVLQRRGLMQTEYAPGTLREKLSAGGPRLKDDHPGARYRFDRWTPEDPHEAVDREPNFIGGNRQ